MISADEILKEIKSANSNTTEMCIAANEFEHSNDVIFKCFLNKTVRPRAFTGTLVNSYKSIFGY